MIYRTLLLALVAIGLASGCAGYSATQSAAPLPSTAPTAPADLSERLESDKVLVVAHRACWLADSIPENSLQAIAECIRIGADMVEIDVALTKDKIPVLMHDTTLDRTTTMRGAIADISYQRLQRARLKTGQGGKHAATTTASVPTLEQALSLAKGRILVNLDVKGAAFDEAFAIVAKTDTAKQTLMKMAAAPDSPHLVQAPFLGKMLYMPILRECTEANVGLYCTARLSETVPRYDHYQPIAYEITYSTEGFFKEGIAAMSARGRVWVNTLSPRHAAGITDKQALQNPNATWGHIIDMGADMIQTDYPQKLIAYLRERDKAETAATRQPQANQ